MNAFEDAFNLLCGDKIGSGVHRNVFACRLRPELVVKVEIDGGQWRYFANAQEMKFWSDQQHYPKVADWLAPCDYMSPDGRILLQRRADPIRSTDTLPENIPSFLNDIKRENFGFLNGRLVCVDYAMHVDNPNLRLKKITWD